MDPQKLASLDPKLRDAYQRVMGTPLPEPQAAPVQAQTPPPPPPMPDPIPNPQPEPEPIPQEPIPPIQEPFVPQSQPSMPETAPPPEPAIAPEESPVQASNFAPMNSEVPAAPSQNFIAPSAIPQAQTVTLKKKNGIMTSILFGIVSLVFIVIYTLFWTKIFNFKLPFLP